MFKFFYVTIFTAILYFFINTFSISEKDLHQYHDIIQRKTKLTSCKNLKRNPIQQTRKDVQKDIFFLQKKDRLHMHISSELSFLNIQEKKGKIIFHEHLKNITCISQDEITKKTHPMQKLKYCTSSFGTYVYPSCLFFSPHMKIDLFEIPGNTLPQDLSCYTPYLKGNAEKVSFSMQKKIYTLHAEHFKAFFDPSVEFIFHKNRK